MGQIRIQIMKSMYISGLNGKCRLMGIMLCSFIFCLDADEYKRETKALQIGAGEKAIVITADKLVLDLNSNIAVFEKNVVAKIQRIEVKADKMSVQLSDAGNDVKKIVCEGRVAISQAEIRAVSGRAVYEVASGRIVLSENPIVRKGKDALSISADRITFYRDTNKMICEPNPILIIDPAEKR